MTKARTVLLWVFAFGMFHTQIGLASGGSTPAIDSLKAVVSQGTDAERVSGLLELARLHVGTPLRGYDYARQVLPIAARLKSDTLQARAYLLMGRSLIFVRDSAEKAEHYCKRSLAIWQRHNTSPRMAQCYEYLGFLNDQRQQFAASKQYHERALILYNKLQNWTKAGLVCNNLSVYYARKEDFLRTRQLQLRALTLLQRPPIDTSLLVGNLKNLGNIYAEQGDTTQSLRYLRQGLALAQEAAHPDTAKLADLAMAFSAVLQQQKDCQQAQAYALRSVQLWEQLGARARPERLSLAYSHVGQAYTRCHHPRALHYLRIAEKLSAQVKDSIELAEVWQAFAKVHDREKRPKLALQYAWRAVQMAQAMKLNDAAGEFYGTLAAILARQGDFSAAYRYDQRADSLHAINFSKVQNQQLLDLQVRYDLAKNEMRVKQLQRVAAAQHQTVLLQNRVRNLLLIGLVLAVCFGGLWYRRYRLQRRQARALKRTKIRLRRLLSDKEVLLKEVHHRVKNNLQIISSMLALQTRSRPEAKEAVREGQNWLRAIALVHEMLYQADDLASVDMQDFLDRLTGLLGTAHGTAIKHAVDASGLQFNTSTAVPLGLIVNELLTNVYKHAFPEGQPGTVRVHLCPLAKPAASGDAPASCEYELTVADDGAGLPAGFRLADTVSLGLRLVKSLARQLGGDVRVQALDRGTRYVVDFKALSDT